MTAPRKPQADRRLERRKQGERQRAAETAVHLSLPVRGQLLLPLMQVLSSQGGRSRPCDLYDAVAQRAGVPDDVRHASQDFAGSRRNLWERAVRHAQQAAVERGFVSTPSRGIWELTEGGKNILRNVRPGILVTVFETDAGLALAARAEDAAGVLLPGSVDLLFSSPPFPLLTGKEYGSSSTAAWLEWMTGLCGQWQDLLAPTGSLVLELGDVFFRGMPVQSQYIERLGIALEDQLGMFRPGRLLWENPARKGSLVWCGIRRVRLAPTAAPLLWMAKSPDPKADNRRVLRPYADRTRKRYIGQVRSDEARQRPGGLDIGATAFAKDNGGAVAGNLIRSGNASGNDAYARACRAAGLKPHPARMPPKVAEFVINFLTEPGDLVYDPFLGSGTTGEVAERLGRRWIGSERSLDYLDAASLRFQQRPGFKVHGQWRQQQHQHPGEQS